MSLIGVLTLLAIVAMAGAAEPRHYDIAEAPQLFEDFMKKYERTYNDAQDKATHYGAFIENLLKINKLNKENPLTTFGINKFADYTAEESKSLHGFIKPKKS